MCLLGVSQRIAKTISQGAEFDYLSGSLERIVTVVERWLVSTVVLDSLRLEGGPRHVECLKRVRTALMY